MHLATTTVKLMEGEVRDLLMRRRRREWKMVFGVGAGYLSSFSSILFPASIYLSSLSSASTAASVCVRVCV
jgi:hypothetical protein